jgi:hypothetical protein
MFFVNNKELTPFFIDPFFHLSGNYTEVKDVGNVITYKVEGLQPGTYYFAVTAYENSRNESGYSNEVSKIIK